MSRRRPGRPSKLTPDAAKAVADAVAAGLPLRVAAARAGVGARTLSAWLAAGRRTGRGPLARLVERVERARAEAQARMIRAVVRATRQRTTTTRTVRRADGSLVTTTTVRDGCDWHAAAWWLERMYPGQYGSQAREVNALRKQLRDLEREVDRLRGVHGGGGDDGPDGGGGDTRAPEAGPFPRPYQPAVG